MLIMYAKITHANKCKSYTLHCVKIIFYLYVVNVIIKPDKYLTHLISIYNCLTLASDKAKAEYKQTREIIQIFA
jgi:hypothetical protein